MASLPEPTVLNPTTEKMGAAIRTSSETLNGGTTADVSTASSSLTGTPPSTEKVDVKATSDGQVRHVSEQGQWKVVSRSHWFQLWLPKHPPLPPPASLDDPSIGVLPLADCSLWSYMTYAWCRPIMTLGNQRPLYPEDLWKIDPSREAALLSDNLDSSWARRVAFCEDYNASLASGSLPVPLHLQLLWMLSFGSGKEKERIWREGGGRKEPSLAWAVVEQFRVFYFSAILFKWVGDTCQMMSPILARYIIYFAKDSYAARQAGIPVPNRGKGVGMAFGMWALTMCWSVFTHQVWWRGMTAGLLFRAALTCSVFKRAVVLSNSARAQFSNGKLMNYLSTDISRIEYAAMWFPSIGGSMPQILLCTGLLIWQIGPSALAGIAFFLLIIPVQTWAMKASIKARLDSMQYTDKRSKLLQELLGAMRVIKYFTFERPYSRRIDKLRHDELRGIRTLLIIRATNTAIAFSLPVLSAVVAFVCYAGTGHTLEPANIFTALSLFQLLRQPLMLLPTAFSAATDAWNAFNRLTELFKAETMDTSLLINPDQKSAIEVKDATFEWVTAPPSTDSKTKKDCKTPKGSPKQSLDGKVHLSEETFRIDKLNLSVEKGSLVAIVGPVGSGKSSLLQGLIGEMKRTSGEVSFSGKVAYCPQTAWIQNATVRDNILFGRKFDQKRYWEVVEQSCLVSDLEMLPAGDSTEIGEKGINLSGGQRQRVNIARALYFDADIIAFDDPLSALDAHVGARVFEGGFLKLREQGKTIVLVTHALHFLPQVDRIFTLEDGHVVESGTYDELLHSTGGAFARLMYDFGGVEEEQDEEDEIKEEVAIEEMKEKPDLKRGMSVKAVEAVDEKRKAEGKEEADGALIKDEARNTGAIKNSVYTQYSRAGHGWILLPTILGLAILMQGTQSVGAYWLVWWQNDHWHKSSNYYMGLYAVLGVIQASMTLILGLAMSYFNFFASRNMHKEVIQKIFYAPSSFFDTVPLGRIMGVCGKDFDTIDNILPESLRNVVMTIATILGSIILITIFQHYFIIAAVVAVIFYRMMQRYYQQSGRELKRLDSQFRSLLYSHFSESLSGLATIRAYGESRRFIKENADRMDLENRAYILYVVTQRWLAIRLDVMGAILILVVALLVAIGPSNSPAQVGLLLTYTVSLVQMFGMLTRQAAEVENNMNSAERIAHYSYGDGVAQEAPYERSDTEPPADWPQSGSISFKNALMSYRPGLPPVLKGISLEVTGGQKVGVVGRTGAGKSTIMSALFRLVELTSGSISIDGIDISTLGLKDLRRSIVMIPQDPLLFSGTLRSNLDPFGEIEDVKLWDALRRAHLVGADAGEVGAEEEKFDLEKVIDEEGANLSVGQRSLVSLARALVREEAKVVVLDEATAAVDLETDAKIQQTIRTELKGKTLLCIAHRLRTIIFYDKILVMDAGRIAEYDSPLNLFRQTNSIFHQMCVKSAISEEEIIRAMADDA